MKLAAVVEHELVPDIIVSYSVREVLYLLVNVVSKVLIHVAQDKRESTRNKC